MLVFGTLHTNSAAKAIDRMIDVFPEEQHEQVRGLLSVLLKGVVAQTLVKRIWAKAAWPRSRCCCTTTRSRI